MTYLIPKAPMHRLERWTAAGGLVLLSLGTVAASLLAGNPAPLLAAWAVLMTFAFVLNPADRVEYLLEPGQLRIGGLYVPLEAVRTARVVNLKGTLVYRGLTLPGFWWGRAWSPGLGKFTLRGSTGMGQGVMLELKDGDRLVFTPRHPVQVVVALQVALRTRPGYRSSL